MRQCFVGVVFRRINKKVPNFKGSKYQLSSVFEKSLRVFFLQGAKYSLLDTISDLQKVIEEAVLDTENALIRKDKKVASIRKDLLVAARSKSFRIVVSNYASDQIDKSGIRGKHLNQVDLLLLKQTGGNEGVVLDLVYDISVTRQNVLGCQTPYQFLEKVLERLKPFKKKDIESIPRLLIATPGFHTWTLTPSCIRLLLENEQSFYDFIEDTVFKAAKSRLGSWIPEETKERIIQRYTDKEGLRSTIRKHFKSFHRLTYRRFRDELLEKADFRNIPTMKKVIDEEFSKVTLSEEELSEVLKLLKLEDSLALANRVFDFQTNEPSYPFDIANKLRLSLIEEGVAIKDPYEIEIAICRAKKIPPSF